MTYLDLRWQLQIFYTTTPASLSLAAHTHKIFLNVVDGVDPGEAISNFVLQRRNLSTVDCDIFIDEYMDLVEPLFFNTSQFIRAELWAMPQDSEDATFYAVLPIGHAGSSATATAAYNGQIMTFRCANGDSARIQLMETTLGAGAKDPFPFSNVASADLADYVAGATSPIVNKRTSYLISPLNNCIEQNEHLWDKRNRNS